MLKRAPANHKHVLNLYIPTPCPQHTPTLVQVGAGVSTGVGSGVGAGVEVVGGTGVGTGVGSDVRDGVWGRRNVRESAGWLVDTGVGTGVGSGVGAIEILYGRTKNFDSARLHVPK